MVFDSKSIYTHSLYIKEKYADNPEYIAEYLSELLTNNTTAETEDDFIDQVRNTIRISLEAAGLDSSKEIRKESAKMSDWKSLELQKELEKASKEIKFRREIEEFYLPRQLIDAIIELGHIPHNSIEAKIGIGFVDLADYSYLSKFLSPMENQSVLNGLFSSFNWALRKRSGYLNKIEGDSIMFHFGGLTDPAVRSMSDEEATKHIAISLFFTCVDLQRICFLFNQADDSFLDFDTDIETRDAVQKAFEIIRNLRSNMELSYSINALFQIRIRIGANIGDVTIGNFGPAGAKQWDVIGMPVIEAKRMESTAPIGGLRISRHFYEVLDEIGVVESYYNKFVEEARETMGYFRDISLDELFNYKKVLLKDKKNAVFDSYSVQVNPSLPEALSDQVKLLLNKGESGIDKIVELLEYYRGNKFVVNAIESVFIQKGVEVKKEEILKTMYPSKYTLFVEKLDNDEEKVKKFIRVTYSLFDLFCKLGTYQDRVNSMPGHVLSKAFIYGSKEYNADTINESIHEFFVKKKMSIYYRTYFNDMIYPAFFLNIRASLYEYVSVAAEEETVVTVEDLVEDLIEEA